MKHYYYLPLAAFLVILVGAQAVLYNDVYAVNAEKTLRYINDRQVVRIRQGRSDTAKIVSTASSGTELELLDQKGKYSQVRTKKGRTGWILSLYLRKTPIARVRLREATKSLQLAKADIREREKKFNTLNTQHKKLKSRYQKLESDFSDSQQENTKLQDLAAEPMKLANENKRLSRSSISMADNIKTLQTEMAALRDETTKQWFLYGAGVVLLGVLIGLLLPKLRQQRKSDWSSY